MQFIPGEDVHNFAFVEEEYEVIDPEDSKVNDPKKQVVPKIAKRTVRKKMRWQAHQDYITAITFVPELGVVASCSFDKNVFMWEKNGFQKKVGSLVLGTGTTQNAEMTEAEKRRYAKIWQIKIDKRPRAIADRLEAMRLIEDTDRIKYEDLLNRHTKGGLGGGMNDGDKIENEAQAEASVNNTLKSLAEESKKKKAR